MLTPARIANWFAGVLLVLTALGFLTFLPGSIGRYRQEPEDVWLTLGWIGGLSICAALCFVNATRLGRRKPYLGFWLTDLNVIALVLLVALQAILTSDDSIGDLVATLLLYLCGIGPMLALLALVQANYAERKKP